MKVEKLKKITAFEENLQQQLATISKLKIALLEHLVRLFRYIEYLPIII